MQSRSAGLWQAFTYNANTAGIYHNNHFLGDQVKTGTLTLADTTDFAD